MTTELTNPYPSRKELREKAAAEAAAKAAEAAEQSAQAGHDASVAAMTSRSEEENKEVLNNAGQSFAPEEERYQEGDIPGRTPTFRDSFAQQLPAQPVLQPSEENGQRAHLQDAFSKEKSDGQVAGQPVAAGVGNPGGRETGGSSSDQEGDPAPDSTNLTVPNQVSQAATPFRQSGVLAVKSEETGVVPDNSLGIMAELADLAGVKQEPALEVPMPAQEVPANEYATSELPTRLPQPVPFGGDDPAVNSGALPANPEIPALQNPNPGRVQASGLPTRTPATSNGAVTRPDDTGQLFLVAESELSEITEEQLNDSSEPSWGVSAAFASGTARAQRDGFQPVSDQSNAGAFAVGPNRVFQAEPQPEVTPRVSAFTAVEDAVAVADSSQVAADVFTGQEVGLAISEQIAVDQKPEQEAAKALPERNRVSIKTPRTPEELAQANAAARQRSQSFNTAGSGAFNAGGTATSFADANTASANAGVTENNYQSFSTATANPDGFGTNEDAWLKKRPITGATAVVEVVEKTEPGFFPLDLSGSREEVTEDESDDSGVNWLAIVIIVLVAVLLAGFIWFMFFREEAAANVVNSMSNVLSVFRRT